FAAAARSASWALLLGRPPATSTATSRRTSEGRVRRLIGIVLLLVLLAVGVQVLRVLWLAGTFRRIQPHFAGECHLVGGMVGPEDITIHPRTGVAYISAMDRRAIQAGKAVPGGIWAYDLNT